MSGQGSTSGDESRERRFEAIFDACYPRVLAYALRRTERRDRAEEVVSETFLVAWRRLDVVPSDPVPWLLGTARRVLANQRRAAGRRSRYGPVVALDGFEPQAPGTPVADLVADREAFATAFAALGARDREVLALTAWDGLKPAEAGKVMGCSAATFSIRLHRARRRLLKELESSGHSFVESGEHCSPRGEPGVKEAP